MTYQQHKYKKVSPVEQQSENKSELLYWLTTPTNQIFRDLAQFYRAPDGSSETHYAYIDNGADILAVAHLDTVQPLSGIKQWENTRIHATGLDDRLGAFTIFNLLPYRVDILLTDHEEIGQSTAQYFDIPTDKTYRYCMEFDRCGTDVVTYDLDSPEFLGQLQAIGSKIGIGSFTDLCYLKTDLCCVNFGTGYYAPHAQNSYANLDELMIMVELSADFEQATRDHGQYIRQERSYTDFFDRVEDNPQYWEPHEIEKAFYCCMCGQHGSYSFEWPICVDCEMDYC